MIGFICGPSVYQYEGWVFEMHSYIGPHPLTKQGSPYRRVPMKFYNMYERWDTLTEEEKENTRLHKGGCVPLGTA